MPMQDAGERHVLNLADRNARLAEGNILMRAAICLVSFLLVGSPAVGSGASTSRVSITDSDAEANDDSFDAAVSADGRFVAFWSFADNLVPEDGNQTCDVFVRDRALGITERVSVASDGSDADGCSFAPSISSDGRFVAYESLASNLTADDQNAMPDVFVYDRHETTTTRASVPSLGLGLDLDCEASEASISGDGRYVAFRCLGILVHDRSTGDTVRIGDGFDPTISSDGRFVAFALTESEATLDVFLHDRDLHSTTRVSVASDGQRANRDSTQPALSSDGRFIAFASAATNLAPNDANNGADVFVHDRDTGATERVSVASDNTPGSSSVPAILGLSISGDGSLVAFATQAVDLVTGDTNRATDVFIHDRSTDITKRVSVSASDEEADSDSGLPALSADGRVVAFTSLAANLVDDDTNDRIDIFVSDDSGSTDYLCPTGNPIARPTLRLTRTNSRDGTAVLTFAGEIPPGLGPHRQPALVGAQLRVEEVGPAGLPLLDLTSQTHPILPGRRSRSCSKKPEGWVMAKSGLLSLYHNDSGAIDPPTCTLGSSGGLRFLAFLHRRGGSTYFVAIARVPVPSSFTGPLRGTIVIGGVAADAAADECASYTFAGCDRDSRRQMTCR